MKTIVAALLLLTFQAAKADVLTHVLERVQASVSNGQQPVIIFDLDDTLFDSRSRKFVIQQEFISQPDIIKRFPQETTILRKLEINQIRYSVKETMTNVGITNQEFIQASVEHWLTKFFTNEYALLDDTIPGSAAFVNQVKVLGAQIVYLTGRDEPRMGQGTLASLENNNFPLGPNDELILKPNKDIDDTIFKQQVFDRIRLKGEVVAAFENEPRNINAMKLGFPNAQMVFLNTLHSPKPDVPDSDIEQIQNFLAPSLNLGQGYR